MRAVETIVTAQLCKWRPASCAPDTLTQRGLCSRELSRCISYIACSVASECDLLHELHVPLHSTPAAGTAAKTTCKRKPSVRPPTILLSLGSTPFCGVQIPRA